MYSTIVFRKKTVICFCLLLLLYSCANKFEGTIMSVKDGDSFMVKTKHAVKEIRLQGIDCPELAQPYGEDAKLLTSNYINKKVLIIKQGKDQYNRILANTYFKEKWINAELIKNGLAWYNQEHQSKTNSDQLSNYENIAKKRKLGLWKDKNPISPWDWRKSSVLSDPTKALAFAPKAKNLKDVVFICGGFSAKKYHRIKDCKCLENCTHQIHEINKAQAISNLKRGPCKCCYIDNEPDKRK